MSKIPYYYNYGTNYRYNLDNPPYPRDNSAYEKNRAEHALGVGTRQTYGDGPSLFATLKGMGKVAVGAPGHLAKAYYSMGKGLVKAPWRTAKGVANLTGARTPSGLTKHEKKQKKTSTSTSTSDKKGGKRYLRKKSSTRKRGKKSSTRKRGKKSSTRKRGKK